MKINKCLNKRLRDTSNCIVVNPLIDTVNYLDNVTYLDTNLTNVAWCNVAIEKGKINMIERHLNRVVNIACSDNKALHIRLIVGYKYYMRGLKTNSGFVPIFHVLRGFIEEGKYSICHYKIILQ